MKKVKVATFKPAEQRWIWMEDMSMSDAVRATIGIDSWFLLDDTGYLIFAQNRMEGDLAYRFKKTYRALKSRGEIIPLDEDFYPPKK